MRSSGSLHRRRAATSVAILLGVSAFAALPPGALAKSKHRKEAPPGEVAPAPEPAVAVDPPPAPAPAPALAAGPVSGDRISYGPPGPGTGSVTLKGDRVQVTFDGRAFGV